MTTNVVALQKLSGPFLKSS